MSHDSQDYGLAAGESVREAANGVSAYLRTAWAGYRDALERLPESERATSLTRDRWLHATRSPVSASYIANDVAPGDVVDAYQTDDKAVIGFASSPTSRDLLVPEKLYLKPVELLPTPFEIHRHKQDTSLQTAWGVRGPLMLSELARENMEDLVVLWSAEAGASNKPKAGGYQP